MSQDASDVHAALLVDEPGDEPVSVAADVENDQVANQIGGRKGSADLVEAGEAVVADEVVPLGKGIGRASIFGVRLDEFPDRSPGDDSALARGRRRFAIRVLYSVVG